MRYTHRMQSQRVFGSAVLAIVVVIAAFATVAAVRGLAPSRPTPLVAGASPPVSTATAVASESQDAVGPEDEDETSDEPEDEDEPEGTADAITLGRLMERLSAADIAATDAETADLASRYGVGGAVRLLAWRAAGADLDRATALRDGTDGAPGIGWGAIARQLNAENPALGLQPGIGWVMRGDHGANSATVGQNGAGRGHGNARGHEKRAAAASDDPPDGD